MMRFWYILLLTYSISLAGFGQRAQAVLDTSVVRIGEQATLTLIVLSRAQDTVVWPAFSDTLNGNIEILDQSEVITRYDTTDITTKYTTQQFHITTYDTGFFPIAPINFIVNNEAIATQPLLFTCQAMQLDTAKGFYDIQEPFSAEFSLEEWLQENWKMVGGILLAILAVVLVLRYLIRRKKTIADIPEVIVPITPAHEIAIEKLEALEREKLWQSGKIKSYHIKLSDIVREYLDLRFGILALEQTTQETIQSLRLAAINPEIIDKLEKSLVLSDLVKFAKELPLGNENEQCLKIAYDLVNRTKVKAKTGIHENKKEEVQNG